LLFPTAVHVCGQNSAKKSDDNLQQFNW
jgi:hypothetical protein